ncbi:uncharacterized protein LOC120635115 isoform X2 [Pararge aegeria]|uniref:Jg17728 protein n=1 Tax=Pararge aegeria aegeria TaxID=348720 RepID=A0A8S4QLH4_9NEOP|nr:uncharacterized protein LOC120635115 isoform X2 [Pararge aegeria]CAH2212672.1 jg17728 [Pararge aegeria aegeria]
MMLATIVWFSLFVFISDVRGSCNITLKDDLGHPSPVYIHNGGFLAPNSSTGAILLRRSETLEIACPGNKKFIVLGNDTTQYDVFTVKCVKDSTFRATKTEWVGNLKDIRCSAPPWFTTEETGAGCSRGHKMYRIGYKIGSKFHELYEACFDKHLLRTLYVKQQLKPESKFIELGRRPSFIEGDVFGQVRMSKLYKIENQKSRLREILGNGTEDKYITKAQHLNRGHLAARADFPLRAQQKATFHYINTAPQWMRGNAGDWAALEEALRRRVHAYGMPVTVYTGTAGVSTLPDAGDTYRQIYLHADENNNRIVPVPMYFYKIVYDPTKQTAATFISINSSYYNNTMIEKLQFCSDICEQNPKYAWLKWRPRDGTHSFCCQYDDFVKTVKDLPKLYVKGLFY